MVDPTNNNSINSLLRAQQLQVAPKPAPKVAQAIINQSTGGTSVAVPVNFKAVPQSAKASFSVNPPPSKPLPRGSIVDRLV